MGEGGRKGVGGGLNKRDRETGVGRGGGRDISICARKLKILKGDKSDGNLVARRHPFISSAW